MNKHKAIGVMSGTSLDGVDIAYCEFLEVENKWQFNIVVAETIEYTECWKNTLSSLGNATSCDFVNTHKIYGHFIGNLISEFIKKNNISPGFIASHGHTIFHQPDKKITFQVGDGAAIAAECGLPVICDFRSSDVAMGGQGAPLVPVGDKFLFADYDYCINLGGIANVSYENNGERLAYDICPANILLNTIAVEAGKAFDKDGELAAAGKINPDLLNELNNIPYYIAPPPKSLGKEYVDEKFISIINKYTISNEDKLNTICEHIAFQIAKVSGDEKERNILVTGGGAYNSYLISRFKYYCKNNIVIPEKNIIEFKEALIFAFLGVLRMTNRINCLSSVTGASRNHSSGAVYLP